jgi:hypothetical protein
MAYARQTANGLRLAGLLTQISELNTCQGVPGPKFHVGIINCLGQFVETRNIFGSE